MANNEQSYLAQFAHAMVLLADVENARREYMASVDQLPPILGRGLREYRVNANLSQKDLADAIGINFTYISKIENGTAVPESVRAALIEYFIRQGQLSLTSDGLLAADGSKLRE